MWKLRKFEFSASWERNCAGWYGKQFLDVKNELQAVAGDVWTRNEALAGTNRPLQVRNLKKRHRAKDLGNRFKFKIVILRQIEDQFAWVSWANQHFEPTRIIALKPWEVSFKANPEPHRGSWQAPSSEQPTAVKLRRGFKTKTLKVQAKVYGIQEVSRSTQVVAKRVLDAFRKIVSLVWRTTELASTR